MKNKSLIRKYRILKVERDLLEGTAVNRYLMLFDRVLVFYNYGLTINLIRLVSGHSLALTKEHLALVDKHFPQAGFG